MTGWMNPWKRNTSLAAASAMVLLLTACGGSPPPLPPPPSTSGGYYGGGGGGATCGSALGTPVYPQGPVTASFTNGVSATLNFSYQGSSLTGSASFNIPQLGGQSSYASTNPNSVVCLSTMTSSGSQNPGQFGITGGAYSIQAYLSAMVPYTIIQPYGLPVLGTSGFNGAPVQYAQASGYISGYIINGTFTQGQAQVSIPTLNYNSGAMSTTYGGYSGYGY